MAGRTFTGDLSHLFDNLNDPVPLANKRETILGVIISCMIVSTSCVVARLYTRLYVIRAPGWDDFMIGLFLLFSIAGTVSIVIAVHHGMGQHFALLPPNHIIGYIQSFYVASATYVTCTALIKLSLILQYLRVYERGTTMHRLCIALLVFTSLWGFAYTFMAWFPCFPVHDMWSAPAHPRCYAFGSQNAAIFTATYESHTGINMVLDILVLAAPVPLYFDKQTTTRTRRGLLLLLFMGVLVNVFSVWRLATIVEHRAATFPTRDPTWYGPISILLAVCEIDAASICASVPVFWPVVSDRIGRIFITQEIKITHEDRFELTTPIPSGGMGGKGDAAGGDGEGPGFHSRNGSETELEPTQSAGGKSKEMHYKDGFVVGLVDPLRQTKTGGVESRIRSDIVGKGGKWHRV